MRVIAALALLLAFITHLLLGVTSLVSAQYAELQARTDANDLSQVAGDIVDDNTLARERVAGTRRADRSEATGAWLRGAGLLLLALLQAIALVLLLLPRTRGARKVIMPLILLSVMGAATMLVLSLSVWSVTGVGLGALSFVLALRAS